MSDSDDEESKRNRRIRDRSRERRTQVDSREDEKKSELPINSFEYIKKYIENNDRKFKNISDEDIIWHLQNFGLLDRRRSGADGLMEKLEEYLLARRRIQEANAVSDEDMSDRDEKHERDSKRGEKRSCFDQKMMEEVKKYITKNIDKFKLLSTKQIIIKLARLEITSFGDHNCSPNKKDRDALTDLINNILYSDVKDPEVLTCLKDPDINKRLKLLVPGKKSKIDKCVEYVEIVKGLKIIVKNSDFKKLDSILSPEGSSDVKNSDGFILKLIKDLDKESNKEINIFLEKFLIKYPKYIDMYRKYDIYIFNKSTVDLYIDVKEDSKVLCDYEFLENQYKNVQIGETIDKKIRSTTIVTFLEKIILAENFDGFKYVFEKYIVNNSILKKSIKDSKTDVDEFTGEPICKIFPELYKIIAQTCVYYIDELSGEEYQTYMKFSKYLIEYITHYRGFFNSIIIFGIDREKFWRQKSGPACPT